MAMYGFTVQNLRAKFAGFPKEDFFAYNEEGKIACVADGVTRDFLDGSVVTRDLKGLVKVLRGKYPSYAQRASQLCVENFLETHSLEEANKSIANYNSDTFREIDYLAHDLAGCTAAGFWEDKEGFLRWQFICDSGIAIIDYGGDLLFRTPDEGPHSKEKLPNLEQVLNQHGGFNNPEGRRIIRSQYRNNPEKKYAYGVLTGEETASPYIRNGKEKLHKGDYVLAFTDGMADIIFNKNPRVIPLPPGVSKYSLAPRLNIDGVPVPQEPVVIPEVNQAFLNCLRYNNPIELEKFCKEKVHSEGTLVVYQNISYPPRGAWGRDMDYEAHING